MVRIRPDRFDVDPDEPFERDRLGRRGRVEASWVEVPSDHACGRFCRRSGIALCALWRSARSGLIHDNSSSDRSHASPIAMAVVEPGTRTPLRIGS